ncbi:hypothetical protein D3C72_874970 [compost metagenome]
MMSDILSWSGPSSLACKRPAISRMVGYLPMASPSRLAAAIRPKRRLKNQNTGSAPRRRVEGAAVAPQRDAQEEREDDHRGH